MAAPTATRYGGHSMTATLRTVMVRRPPAVLDPEVWRDYSYLRPMDAAQAEIEHGAFRSILAAEGISVIEAGHDAPGLHDAIFTFDPSIMTDAGAVLCRMGKRLRAIEPALAEQMYADLGIPVIGRIEEPGLLEGGDTMWVDEHTLAVGLGYRTNAEGVRHLQAIFDRAGLDVEVVSFHLPHWNGPSECLHLLSMISPVAAGLAIAYPKLMAVPFVQLLHDRGWRLVEIPDEEFPTQGCNVLALAPGRCLMLQPNPVAKAKLEAEGCTVLTYRGDEISHNRGGGPTCLTRPIWRSEENPL